MSKWATVFLVAAILSLLVAFIWHKNPVVDGLGKAMFGVFMILYFIDRFFGFGKENAS